MVATDVLGRGIDIEDIGLVVNYEMPNTIEHYTHRVGRTGRAGKKGRAVSFVTRSDSGIIPALKKTLLASGASIPFGLADYLEDDEGPVFFD
mmetsp:Transcript_25055/g.46807  ORF Transcript_25055/g.46807 Transcript_25055/m.46807 type:complete len:92 (+) Transcript_25055:52-327(+)